MYINSIFNQQWLNYIELKQGKILTNILGTNFLPLSVLLIFSNAAETELNHYGSWTLKYLQKFKKKTSRIQ